MQEHIEDCFHLGVKALIYNCNDQVLLLQINPKKIKNSDEVCWDLPGGRIKRNESIEDALKREVFEETGLKHLSKITSLSIALSQFRIPFQNNDVGLILAVFACKLDRENPIALSEEHVHCQLPLPKGRSLLKET